MRLYIPHPLKGQLAVPLSEAQDHYLRRVMRQTAGATVHLFNGQDGEWACTLDLGPKRGAAAIPQHQTRPQTPPIPLRLLIPPIKRLDILLEKVTELGVGHIHPLLTQHTSTRLLNSRRCEAWIIEAAEQAGHLRLPQLHPIASLQEALRQWPAGQPLFWAVEPQGAATLTTVPRLSAADFSADMEVGFLIGPEGGWSTAEKALLQSLPFIRPFSLGNYTLRSETAALVAVALYHQLTHLNKP